MKKKILSKGKTIAACVLGLAIVAVIGFNIHLQMESQKKMSDSDVTIKNIEALSQETDNQTQLWTPHDHICEYTFQVAANATVSISLFGQHVATLQATPQGVARYTYTGRVTCTANGNQQCTAQYCAALFVN